MACCMPTTRAPRLNTNGYRIQAPGHGQPRPRSLGPSRRSPAAGPGALNPSGPAVVILSRIPGTLRTRLAVAQCNSPIRICHQGSATSFLARALHDAESMTRISLSIFYREEQETRSVKDKPFYCLASVGTIKKSTMKYVYICLPRRLPRLV